MKKIFYGLTIFCTILNAADGNLDTSFNSTGMASYAVGGTSGAANAVVLQPDGKIVTCGFNSISGFVSFVLVRFNRDGSVDTSFGTNGQVTVNMGGVASAVLLQPDAKIVQIGVASSNSFFGLTRHLSNGSLDPSFGNGGIVTTDLGTNPEQAFAGVLQPDGKIIAGGLTTNGGSQNFGLTRYNPNGSLDTSFGTGGLVRTDFGVTGADQLFALLLQPDGKIIAVGRATIAADFNFGVARYNVDGSLDATFGTGGLVTTNFGGTSADQARGGILQPDGKIIAGGFSNVSGANDFALVRYNSDGSLDTSFGTGGLVTTDLGGDDQGRAVMLQPDGKVLLAGLSTVAGTSVFAIVRYNPNGSVDTSFGTNGVVRTSFGGTTGQAIAISIQADGKLVVAGQASTAVFGVARYLIPSITISSVAQSIRDKYLLNSLQDKGFFN